MRLFSLFIAEGFKVTDQDGLIYHRASSFGKQNTRTFGPLVGVLVEEETTIFF